MQLLDATEWLTGVSRVREQGFDQFVTLMALDDGGTQLWLRLRSNSGQIVVLAAGADSPLPSISELFPAASWCEREAAEMFGIVFTGADAAPLLLAAGATPPMPKSTVLESRQTTPWPGEKEPGGVTARRRTLPPGVVGVAR